MKRVRVLEFAALGLSVGLTPTFALAQSVDISLNYAVNTGYNYGGHIANPVLILTINVGVNGGAAQPYAFDTGSSVFLSPSGVFTGATVLASGVGNVETYGSGSGNRFSGNLYQAPVSSLQFYAAPGATSGGISLGTSGNYNVASYTLLNGSAPPAQPFGTAAVGVFGASGLAFTKNVSGTDIGLGSVFGQTVLRGTTAGYVVSANGQSLAALNLLLGTTIPGGPATGAQQSIQTVPQSVTSCNPCVTLGLTPALLAQFLPLNTVNAAGNGTTFSNSNAPDISKFVPFNFTLTAPGNTQQFTQSVSLDTGWTDFALSRSSNSAGTALTIAAKNGGAQETFNIATSSGVPSPYRTSPSSDGFIGTGFFVQNSVLFDLAGQQVGYSPNFVTDANISTAQPLVIDSSSVPLGLAGIISGPGGVSVGPGGSATLSGSNTYTGPTSISGAAAYLALVGPGTISASSEVTVTSGGTFDISNASSPATIRSLSGDSNGVVFLGTNYLALSAAGGLFAGTMIGSGGLELISGNETLSGTNGYTGITLVGGGTLSVNGSIANSALTIVGPGATLTGSGTVGALTVLSGGTFAPAWGTPAGSMTVAGNLAFQSGAIFLAQANPSVASANVTGSATLGGATANAVFANGSYISKTYTILSANGGVSGTFAPGVVSTNLPSNFSTSLGYDATHAYLDLALNYTPSSGRGLSGNQQAIANALVNYFNTNGGIPLRYGLLNVPGLTQASGESATGTQQTTFQAMSQFVSLLTDPSTGRGNGINGATSAPGYAGEDDSASAYAASKRLAAERDAYAMFTKAPLAKAYAPRWSVWAAGFGGSQTTNGDPNVGSNDTRSSISGTAVGADYLLSPRTLAGFSLAGGGTNFSANNLGAGRSDLFQAGAYVRHTNGAAYIAGALAYGWQDITTNRTVTIAGFDQLRAEFNANAYSGRVEGGYRFVAPWIGGVGLTPYAAGQFTTFDLPAYAESVVTGAPNFALNYAAKSVTDTRSELGIRTDKSLAVQNGILTLRGRLAWAHDFDPDRSIAATFQALPGASFVVNGAAQAPDAALTTAAAEMKWLNGWSAAASFEGQFSNVTRSYAGKGVARYSW